MDVGIVVIGRNEGERLARCLASLPPPGPAAPVVYVDSGSVDGSVSLARGLGAVVVELDAGLPFSAARARNEGFRRLMEQAPGLDRVQFVDGDCELFPGWLAAAAGALASRSDLAAVAGRLHERHPEASIYNRLGELEWNQAGPGEVEAVGGIFMIRCRAFAATGGFDPSVAAGEEPELCQRLRRQGWRLLRMDIPMAWHDLAMTRFGQWWRRQERGGYGGLDVARRFGLARFRRNGWRARFWSAWPVLAMAAGAGAGPVAALAVLALFPWQLGRIALRTWRGGQPPRVALAYGFFTLLSFWPQMLGQGRYLLDRRRGRAPRLIEYKAVAGAPDAVAGPDADPVRVG